MQDRHVAYRELKASLGISSTSLHSRLQEELAVKRIWIPHNLTIAQKKVRADWYKEMLENCARGASKDGKIYGPITSRNY